MNVLGRQFNVEDLLYTIPREMHDKERIRIIIKEHPEIKFASLAAVDLMGNDTEKKIPIENFIENYDNLNLEEFGASTKENLEKLCQK